MNTKPIFVFLSCFWLLAAQSQAPSPSVGMGKGLYMSPGANSCMYCHGVAGEGGKVAAAAKLDHPKQWKVYKALGGEAVYKKDPKAFVEKMKSATVHLIQVGAIRHNGTYGADGYNKAAIAAYNVQMLGLGGAPSMAWLKKYQDKGMTPEIAAESAWLFVQTLDKDGIFKN